MASETGSPKQDITAADAKEYVEQGGVICPFCRTTDISAGRFDASDRLAWSDVECQECGAIWQDVYRLDRMEVRETPDGRTFEPDEYKPKL